MKKTEFCILPKSYLYEIARFNGSERHEIFFGANRNKSIEDGLVVFLTPEQHRGTTGVHGKDGHEFDVFLKQEGEKAWLNYYKKTSEDFIKRYGKNYL